MNCRDLFSLENKKKIKKMSSAAVVTGALRVKALNLNISSWYFDFFFLFFSFS